MARSKSSKLWLQEHFKDPFVKKAQIAGYRSRAVYKLQEVDEKESLIKPGMVIVDLGAAPGSWSEYAAKKIGNRGQIIALDILSMKEIPGVHCIQGDFQEVLVLEQVTKIIDTAGIDLILSDMAPNMSGMPAIDIPKSMALTELALDFADQMLKPGGTLFTKIFTGAGLDVCIQLARQKFKKVMIWKPKASRARSREIYLLAKGYAI